MMAVLCSRMDGGVWMHACWGFWGFTLRKLRWTLGSIVTKLPLVSLMLWVHLSPHKCTPSRQRSLGDVFVGGTFFTTRVTRACPQKKKKKIDSFHPPLYGLCHGICYR